MTNVRGASAPLSFFALKTPPFMRITQYFKMEDFIMTELLIVTAIVVVTMLVGVAYDCVIEAEMEEIYE